MAAPVPSGGAFDLHAAQHVELADDTLLRPAVTQSLEFDKVRGERTSRLPCSAASARRSERAS